MPDPILRMRGISKSFPGVKALDDVDLELYAGEVLALVGENGAGKSTLLKILSGAYLRDEGLIEFDGKELGNYTPRESLDMGVAIIYQEIDNFQTLTVAENILVNNLPVKNKFKQIDWKESTKRAQNALNKITDEVQPNVLMSTLSTAQQQLVEIAKAVDTNMKVLVMDEPTSALNRIETERLLKLVRQIADSGVGVVYISHRMDEIFSVSDRIQVMRDGKSVAILKTSETDRNVVVNHMVGRTLDEMYPHVQLPPGEKLLEVRDLSAGKVKNVNFSLYKGEILGLFGLMGAGRTDLARILFGDISMKTGEILIKGKKISFSSPEQAIANGIAYIPSERKIEGLLRGTSVKFNTTISIIKKLMKFLRLDLREEEKITQKWIQDLKIRTPSSTTPIDSLSGGNQQKVVIAKWLETNPTILILNDPTRGIDVGAKVDIYGLMERLSKEGIGIIMISSELQETLAMSDRVLVMCEGRLAGEVSREKASQEVLMKLAVGSM
ncbi:MAG: sugar ABC transporter ATP-binding protein [Sphaerochaetaceae bacterium]|jgi:ABC-type sugar transport system ATPase subunit